MNQIKSAINSIIDLIYPVGFIISTENATFNPNNLYKGTTWERIKGKVIVGVDEDDTDFASSGLTGGEKEHTLTEAEMPKHNHPGIIGYTNTNGNYARLFLGTQGTNLADEGKVGGGQAHNNMPPFYTAYMWRRTA